MLHFWMLPNTNLHFKSFQLSHKLLRSVLRCGKYDRICISIINEFPQNMRKYEEIYYERLGDFSVHSLLCILLAKNNYEITHINQTRTPNAQHRNQQSMAQLKAFEVQISITQHPEMDLTALVQKLLRSLCIVSIITLKCPL